MRYYLSANMPDTSDSDFTWGEFVRRNNGELVGTYGNLVHRVLTINYRNFDGKVPSPGPLSSDETDMLDKVNQTFAEVDDLLYRCRFKEAIRQAMTLGSGGEPIPGPQSSVAAGQGRQGRRCHDPLVCHLRCHGTEDHALPVPALQLPKVARLSGAG